VHRRPLAAGPASQTPSPEALRARFAATQPFTVGLEEEVLLVGLQDPAPVPEAEEVVARAGWPGRIKEELPSCQVELATGVHPTVAGAVAELAAARARLADACAGLARPIAAAVHPSAVSFAGTGPTERHRALLDRYAWAGRRQLVSSLQVHVAIGDPLLVLPTYNRLREHLPSLAAIGAAAPFHEGEDTDLASIRPLLCGVLPRQGVPPVLHSWEHFASELAWGTRAAALPDVRHWWWELRPHPATGTLEVRVLDVQPTIAAAGALAELTVAVVALVVASVSAEAEHGHVREPVESWRIEENRWSAVRHGIGGTMADVRSGEVRPTRSVVEELLLAAAPHADGDLLGARAMLDRNAATALRSVGPRDAVDWLAAVFV
jgi:carboxylate-amine ligase